MRNFIISSIALIIASISFGQCPTTYLNLQISDYSVYDTTHCNTTGNVNDVRDHEYVYFRLENMGGTSPDDITWKVNGSAEISSSTDLPHDFEFEREFTSTGSYQITCIYDFNTSCSDTLIDTLVVSSRNCPYISVDSIYTPTACEMNGLVGMAYIDYYFEFAGYSPYSITNIDWLIVDSNGDSWNYSSVGNTFTYSQPPSQGNSLQITGMATIDLGSGNYCFSPIEGNCGIEVELDNLNPDAIFEIEGALQTSSSIDFIYTGSPNPPTFSHYHYDFYIDSVLQDTVANALYGDTLATQTFTTTGEHTAHIKAYLDAYGDRCFSTYQKTFVIDTLDPEECISCNSFKPNPDEKYWLSAWVKEDHSEPVKTYEFSQIKLVFTGSSTTDIQFTPGGEIIDGWQRIVGSFSVPSGTTGMDIKLLNNNSSIDAYFDDVRIHPFNASMKSYVYDPETLWLSAELDDNNYATFYEYDMEGQLIRIKKETSRGVMTIQESRSSNPKKD